ncbi:osteoclast-stimulating factor 1 [Hydra vulgaris]|uniref:Osteoclast-stimulating factor 1 n=1 Tax=Hydra vulgaris TaxID=6087 RepID=T2M8K7_HYDVU|nr:osteoclast-stimulating factor 1 [Hydra vulgaris]
MSIPNRPAPPPPSRPGHVQVVKAIYAYSATRGDELSFEEGDLLYIIDKTQSNGWWKARVGNKTGLIPSNYVDENTESIDNPLHEAAKRGNVDFLNECLNNKVSINGLDKSGSTALHWAASGGHMACAVALLNEPNISLDVQNKLGDTALHNASWKGHTDIVEALIERGANTSIKNNEKKTAYDLARKPEVAKLLKSSSISNAEDYGADDDEDDE